VLGVRRFNIGERVTLEAKSRRGRNKLQEVGEGNWEVRDNNNPFKNHHVWLVSSCDSIPQGIWVSLYDDPDYVIVE